MKALLVVLLLHSVAAASALDIVERFRFTPSLEPGASISSAQIAVTHRDGSVLLGYRAGRDRFAGLAPDGQVIFEYTPRDYAAVRRETNLVDLGGGVFAPEITEFKERDYSSIMSSALGAEMRPLVWFGNRHAIVFEYALRSFETNIYRTSGPIGPGGQPLPSSSSLTSVTNRLIKFEGNAEIGSVLLMARHTRIGSGGNEVIHSVPPILTETDAAAKIPRIDPHRYSKLLIPSIDGEAIVIYEVRDADVFPDASITLSGGAGGNLQAQASGSGERPLVIERSADLRQWQAVGDLPPEDPFLNVLLPASEPMEFLRLREK
jgi:hypothetical protein